MKISSSLTQAGLVAGLTLCASTALAADASATRGKIEMALQSDVREGLKGTSNKEAAAAVGKFVAERAVEAGVKEVAFDRSGYQYHGRIKELADAAREVGLKF